MKKIVLNQTPELKTLVQAIGSKDKDVARTALAALTKQLEPTLDSVLNQERVLSDAFAEFRFNEDDNPTLPTDLYSNNPTENDIQVWSQTAPGGLASNLMVPYNQEIHFATHSLQTAVSFYGKHARGSRYAVIEKSLNKIVQTLLYKEEIVAANILLQVLAAKNATQIVTSAATGGVIQVADFNALMLLADRAYTSWAGGSTADAQQTVTDMFVSPERMADFRGMGYNPVNTKGANQTAGTNASGVVIAPEDMRSNLFKGGGLKEFYGVTLHKFNEFGPNRLFTKIFEAKMAEVSATFNAGDDIMLGFDKTKDFAFRPTSVNGAGNTLTLAPDNQFFLTREDKVGMYGEKNVGHLVLDHRPILGIRVRA